jgi:hypothetical protein
VKDYQVSIALRGRRLPCLRHPALAPASALIDKMRLIGSRIQNGCLQRRSPAALRALNLSGMSQFHGELPGRYSKVVSMPFQVQ